MYSEPGILPTFPPEYLFTMTQTQRQLVNMLGFQLCWFACVMGGNLTGLVVVSAFMFWHCRIAERREWLLIAVVTVSGAALDTLWYQLGLMSFSADHQLAFIPPWLLLLWLAFSATLRHSLSFLFSRPLLMAVASAMAAPLSYFAGTRLGALSVSYEGLLVISVSWALLMWLATLLNRVLLREIETELH